VNIVGKLFTGGCQRGQLSLLSIQGCEMISNPCVYVDYCRGDH